MPIRLTDRKCMNKLFLISTKHISRISPGKCFVTYLLKKLQRPGSFPSFSFGAWMLPGTDEDLSESSN